MEIQVYLPAALAMALATGFCCLFWFLARWRPLNPSRLTKEKLAPFECGSDPIGSPRGRYSVKFYQVAILFLVFDIESAFMYPWAVKYRDLSFPEGGGVSLFGFGEMLVFIAILGVALTYVWRKRAIGWD